MTIAKAIKDVIKRPCVVRYLLTVGLLIGVYSETGIFTTLTLALIHVDLELIHRLMKSR